MPEGFPKPGREPNWIEPKALDGMPISRCDLIQMLSLSWGWAGRVRVRGWAGRGEVSGEVMQAYKHSGYTMEYGGS